MFPDVVKIVQKNCQFGRRQLSKQARHELTHCADKYRIKVRLCPFIKGVNFPPGIAKTFCKVLKCSTFLLKVSPSVLGQCNTFVISSRW